MPITQLKETTMLTDKETHHFCKDCKHLHLVTDPNDPSPFRCSMTGRAIGRYQIMCDAEKKRRLQAGETSAHKPPWYMIYICNTTLSRKPG